MRKWIHRVVIVDRAEMSLERLPVRAPVVSNASTHFDTTQPFLPIPLSNLTQSWAEYERRAICLQGGSLYNRSVTESKTLCVFQQLKKATVDAGCD